MSELHRLLSQVHGKRVAVIGGGLSGVAAAELLVKLGAEVLVSDKGARGSARADLLALEGRHARLEFDGHSERVLESDLIIKSPGVDPREPVLATARSRGVLICGELEVGFHILPKTAYCAITGTNGKTTTTALIGHILQTSGRRTIVAGNIGEPLARFASRYVDDPTLPKPDVIVLEVSSFQSEALQDLRAGVAVYLNLTPDHLDRYANFEEYAAAKARLFALQQAGDVAVLNADDPAIQALKPRLPAKVAEFSTAHEVKNGAFLRAPGVGVLRDAAGVEETFTLDRGVLRGVHNRQNQLAAIAAASALGASIASIQEGLDTFAGVEHRIERAGEVRGVVYYNDSKATNDDAAAKALAAFSEPVIWLAGGRDKGGGYRACVAAARGKVKTAILFGEAAPLIAQALRGVCDIERVPDLGRAVDRAVALAARGDVVLLSPACASYDQFKNYEERGRAFKALVDRLGEGGAS